MNEKKRSGVRPRSTSPEPPLALQRSKMNAENAWQYPSTRRCLACGQLGCTTCGGKIDPEQKKMRLETLKLNTPYERQKLKRLHDELLQEEAQARRALLDAWELSRGQLLDGMRASAQLIRICKKERKTRLFLSKEESAQRALLVTLLDHQTVQVHLLEAESKGRGAIVSRERAARQLFAVRAEHVEKMATVVCREQCTRDSIAFNECALWNKLLAAEADAKSAMATHHKEQSALLGQYFAIRGDIEGCWKRGMCQLRDTAAAHRRWIDDLMQERVALYTKREAKANELFANAMRSYHRMRTEKREEEDFIEEQKFLLDRKLEGVEREEQFARQGVMDDHASGVHRLFVAMAKAEEDVHKAERYKVSQQEGEMSRALSRLIAICAEEDDAMSRLLALEAHEREQRGVWVATKHEDRQALVVQWEGSVQAVRGEEDAAWNLLLRQVEEGEMHVLAAAASRDRMARELYNGFVLGLQELSASERDARFHIISLMSEGEEMIRKWARLRQQQLLDMDSTESHERDALLFAEEKSREELFRDIEATRGAVLERERVQQEQLCALQEAPAALAATLWEEQEVAFAVIGASFYRDYAAAVATAHWREELDCLHREGEQRQRLVQEEMTARCGIAKLSDEHLRCTFAALLSQWATRLMEVEVAQERERERLASSEDMAFTEIAAVKADHFEAAKKREAFRVRQELLQRQVALQEDARASATEVGELLPFSETAPLSAATLAKAKEPQALSEVHVFKQKLILSQLGIPAAAGEEGEEKVGSAHPLTAEAVDALTLLLDVINGKRSDQHQQLRHVEKVFESGAKKVASLEETLGRESEKKEQAALCLERDEEERRRRLENDANEKKRGTKQIEIEQRRKAEVESALKAQQEEIESIKQCIHGRR